MANKGNPTTKKSFLRHHISRCKSPEDLCGICLETYSTTSKDHHNAVSFTHPNACKHIFGDHCIREWLKDHNTCPLCRIELFRLPRSSSGSGAQRSRSWFRRALQTLRDRLLGRPAAAEIMRESDIAAELASLAVEIRAFRAESRDSLTVLERAWLDHHFPEDVATSQRRVASIREARQQLGLSGGSLRLQI
ncbi:hypothetical protein BDV96DRAFT_629538 [Lophiotrema nucula]|uniref:RING-type domain-containing protein n=1 Tax=Lophiotrema nucula TaxID=690887 RepID=A0A6A5ZIK3_9PLEO|nr:hypothetical protein BDV96DRAFT_629538 [Lophiotrema nucula]